MIVTSTVRSSLSATFLHAIATIAVFCSSLQAQNEASVLAERPTLSVEPSVPSASGVGTLAGERYFVVQLADEPAASTFDRESKSRGRKTGLEAARGQVQK